MKFIKNSIKKTVLYSFLEKIKTRKYEISLINHDQRMLEIYSQFIAANDVCFDVGANIGNRTKIFLELGAKVIAVEPQDACVTALKERYGSHQNLTIVEKALGASEGEAEMMISNAHVLSSLSQEWIASVNKSGRFSMHRWDKKQIVQVTTLDRLIEQYGVPSFMKIDVEGFEYQVLQGLSQPIKALSLEFTPELIESTFRCIRYLQNIGNIYLNYSLGETMILELKTWVNPQEMMKILSNFKNNNQVFGDLYVKFQD